MNISFGKKVNTSNIRNRYSKYGPAKRHIAKWQWYVVVLILISPLLFIFYKIISANLDDSFRGFVYFNTIAITAPDDGYIVNDKMHIGSKVKKGQEIIILNSQILRDRLSYLEKRLIFLELRNKDTITQNNSVYKQFIKNANTYLKAMNQFLALNTYLRARGLGTIYNVHSAVMDDFNILMSKEMLKYNRFYYQSEVTRLGYEIINTEKEIATIKERLNEFDVKSPVNGEIVKLNGFKGEYIPKDKEVALIADYDNMYIRAYMPPEILNDGSLLEGRKVDIFFGQRFYHSFVRTGTIIGVPSTTEAQTKVIQPEEKNTILYIKVHKPIPQNYYTLGYPVKVRLQNA